MDENDVISAVCAHLETNGYEISSRCHTSQRGIDVCAKHKDNGKIVLVEAKGGTSSKLGTNRFGQPYTKSQVFDRVAKGIFTCMQLRADSLSGTDARVILALPNGAWFQEYIASVGSGLSVLNIEVWYAT